MATTNTPHVQEDVTKGKSETSQGPTGQTGQMGQMVEKAKETAGNIGERARVVASDVAGRAKEMASSVGNRAEDATHALGSGMQSLAGSMREKLPHEGVVGSAASTLAGGLESGGQYLQEGGLKGIAQDVTNLIRRNPVPAMLIGLAVGFILARATTRS
jgi:hypothetical protein